MDYRKELKDLLRPLRVFDVDNGVGSKMLECVGTELNAAWEKLEETEREANPLTAEGEGLERWETLLPFVPVSRSTAERRNAITALLQIDGTSFTADALNRTLAGCGVSAAMRETGVRQTVEVLFPGTRGVPERFDELAQRIERILPCHLSVQYVFAFLLWREVQTLFHDWGSLMTEGPDWNTLERLGEAAP